MFDKACDRNQITAVFKRLCYLVAEGFEICSISGYDCADDLNARVMYRYQNSGGCWRLRSEDFRVEEEESRACARFFLQYLQSEGPM